MASDVKTEDKDSTRIDESNIDIIELQTVAKVRRTIVSLEFAIKSWNDSKVKPKALKQKFVSYKKLHDDLVRWDHMARKYTRKSQHYQMRLRILNNLASLLKRGA